MSVECRSNQRFGKLRNSPPKCVFSFSLPSFASNPIPVLNCIGRTEGCLIERARAFVLSRSGSGGREGHLVLMRRKDPRRTDNEVCLLGREAEENNCAEKSSIHICRKAGCWKGCEFPRRLAPFGRVGELAEPLQHILEVFCRFRYCCALTDLLHARAP